MKTAKVVIGAGFGDEGKGHLTDYFASTHKKDCLVVRFNGGAQAGHTVVTPDFQRHVFHHFGSGTLTGAKTYLSKFFVINPILFRIEWNELINKGVTPIVFVDHRCLITLPHDMIINQIVEESRGYAKHGSCGLGFNETIVRNQNSEFHIDVNTLLNDKLLFDTLLQIVSKYIIPRLQTLGVYNIPSHYIDFLSSSIMIKNYFEDIKFFLSKICRADEIIMLIEDNVIFEGAQGLLLDQNLFEYFPYLTRSNTGITNVIELIPDTDITSLDITYVTRAYTTRHGIGPFPHEYYEPPYFKVEDQTNVPNKFQGSLRIGKLDVDNLYTTIHKDLLKIDDILYTYNLAITCLDQIGDQIEFVDFGYKQENTRERFIDHIGIKFGVPLYLGNGPTRNQIIKEMEYENSSTSTTWQASYRRT